MEISEVPAHQNKNKIHLNGCNGEGSLERIPNHILHHPAAFQPTEFFQTKLELTASTSLGLEKSLAPSQFQMESMCHFGSATKLCVCGTAYLREMKHVHQKNQRSSKRPLQMNCPGNSCWSPTFHAEQMTTWWRKPLSQGLWARLALSENSFFCR